jgi:hypothetical protein
LGESALKGISAGQSKGISVNVKSVRLAVSASLVALIMGGLAMTPARAATPAQAVTPAQDETWLGQIQREGNQYAYVGRACPEQAEICYDILARYRIVALNPAAARSVRRLAGGQARLHAHLGPGQDQQHNGTHIVRKAERPKPPAPKTVLVDDNSNGQTVTLGRGDHLQVVLHSTYWTFNRPSDPAVISADRAPKYAPGGPNCPKYPGSGCGTVTVRYTARGSGAAVISADRTSCGEAVRCTPAALHWSVKVNVAG